MCLMALFIWIVCVFCCIVFVEIHISFLILFDMFYLFVTTCIYFLQEISPVIISDDDITPTRDVESKTVDTRMVSKR